MMNKRTAFKGRHEELQLLDGLWDSGRATLLILYGRRRVGKTRLLTHWLGRHADQAIYWVAEPTSALHQLRSFSQAIYNYSHPGNPAPRDFSYADWEQAFEEVAVLAQRERLALVIDEVTYLIEVDNTIAGTLQKIWDHTLSQTNLFMALSGSQMGLMQKEMVSYKAPLYGRATAQLRLPPLPYSVTQEFFPHYTVEDRVAIYAIFGGIPAYWERLDPALSVMENVQSQLLTSNTLMQEEPRLLLQDFITDTNNYVGIMRAIAHGSLTQSAISKHTGLSQGHVSKNLSVLRETSFVQRQVPVTETASRSRRGHYHVTDPYLRFYYRFLSQYQTQVALGAQQEALREIEEHLPAFLETHTWRELCQDWVRLASARGELPVTVEDVGGAWTRTQYFDVVGISRLAKTLIIGVCQWNGKPLRARALRDLIKRTGTVVPKSGQWTVFYIGFGAHGWEKEAASLVDSLSDGEGSGGKNWEVAGGLLVDLPRVDAELCDWTGIREPVTAAAVA